MQTLKFVYVKDGVTKGGSRGVPFWVCQGCGDTIWPHYDCQMCPSYRQEKTFKGLHFMAILGDIEIARVRIDDPHCKNISEAEHYYERFLDAHG